MIDKVSYVESVKCEVCGKIHEVDSYEYFTIHGNLTKGLDFGLVVDNLDENYNLKKASVLCCDCLRKTLFPSSRNEGVKFE